MNLGKTANDYELVNATKCAEILTNELDRPVKRPYLSRLAAEEKITYHLVKGQKLFNPIEVLHDLPAERMTSSKFEDIKPIQDEVYNIPSDKDLINHFKANGFKFEVIPVIEEYPEFSDTIGKNCLPFLQLPTIKDVKKELSVLELCDKQKELITDEYIEKNIKELNPSFTELNTLWANFMSLKVEKDYKEQFDTNVDGFTASQMAYIKYLLLDSFCNAEVIADCIDDETFNLVQD